MGRAVDLNAAWRGYRPLLNEMIRWGRALPLLKCGADPNLPDGRGWAAVHQAATRGNRRMLQAVAEAGGDLRRENLQGRTPLDLANLPVCKILTPPAPE